MKVIKLIIDKLFPPTSIPLTCDRCKRSLQKRFVSVNWGEYNYICMNCYKTYSQYNGNQ